MARDKYKPSIKNEKKILLELSGTNYVDLVDVSKKLGLDVRSVLRYIKKMKVNGIDVKRKPGKGKLYMIEEFNPGVSSQFSEDEFTLLMKVMENVKQLNEILSHKLLKLIYYNTESTGNFKNEIAIIKEAIKKKYKFKIGKYHAREKSSVDLIITPVSIDISRKKVIAYHEGKFKTYNMENMVKVSSMKVKADDHPEWKPEPDEYDVFGFNYYKEKIEVELLLTMFARSQLVRQFPIMEKYLYPYKNERYQALLKITVHDIQPIARFVTGLFNEIKVTGSKRAKELIKDYYFKRVLKGFDENFTEKSSK